MEWINYIYYNQQRFINYTDDALKALREQLAATSQMTLQNRQVLDWMMAKDGGVMFGKSCCTFVPNHTSKGGDFQVAMEKLTNRRKEVKTNSGVYMYVPDWFGEWGGVLLNSPQLNQGKE